MTIGETLKRARKKMNLDLDEVAKVTKIAKMFLIALESDDIVKLPEGVYARNFLRTYAKFLQLDEDIMTAEYHDQYRVKPHFVVQHEQTKNDNVQFKRERNKNLLLLLLLIGIILAAVWVYMRYGDIISREFTARTEPGRNLDSPAATTQPVAAEAVPSGTVITPQKALDEDKNSSPPTTEAITSPQLQTEEPPSDGAAETGESTDEAGEADAIPPSEEPTATGLEASFTPPPVSIGDPQTLPVSSLEAVVWTGSPGDRLEQMFAFEALADVKIAVNVDGLDLTTRLLPRGQVRFYRYGATNTVVIGDASRIAFQDGTTFMAKPSLTNGEISVTFRPGELSQAINAAIAKPVEQQP